MLRPRNTGDKLSKTALLAGAAIAFPVASKANVVFVNSGSVPFTVTSPQQPAMGTDTPVTQNFTIDGVTPFSFSADGGVAGSSSSIEDWVTALLPTSGWVGPASNLPEPFSTASSLAAGTEIGADLNASFAFYTGPNTAGTLQKTDGDPTMTAQKGPWPTDGSSSYLGIEFEDSSNALHYGWIQLSACTPDNQGMNAAHPCNDPQGLVTVTSFAYQSQAGVGIQAGQTSDAPEPSSIALFALGAAGLAAYRRKKLAA